VVSRENALSIYVPKKKAHHRPIERLSKLAEEKDRSVNYLIVDAILQYLDQMEEEKK